MSQTATGNTSNKENVEIADSRPLGYGSFYSSSITINDGLAQIKDSDLKNHQLGNRLFVPDLDRNKSIVEVCYEKRTHSSISIIVAEAATPIRGDYHIITVGKNETQTMELHRTVEGIIENMLSNNSPKTGYHRSTKEELTRHLIQYSLGNYDKEVKQ